MHLYLLFEAFGKVSVITNVMNNPLPTFIGHKKESPKEKNLVGRLQNKQQKLLLREVSGRILIGSEVAVDSHDDAGNEEHQ